MMSHTVLQSGSRAVEILDTDAGYWMMDDVYIAVAVADGFFHKILKGLFFWTKVQRTATIQSYGALHL